MTNTLTIIGIYLLGMFISLCLWFKWNPAYVWDPEERKRKKELAECAKALNNPQTYGDFIGGLFGAAAGSFEVMGNFVLSLVLSLLSYISIVLFLIAHVFYYVKYKLS